MSSLVQLAQERLTLLLTLAYSGELAATRAYLGHRNSVASRTERAEIARIIRDEVHHRHCLLDMLGTLGAAPDPARERKMERVGRSIALFCHVGGWFFPMYGAAKLEAQNIREYEIAARLARCAEREALVAPLLEMAEVEWDHELYFRQKAASHFLWPWMPKWPLPPPREEIQLSFRAFELGGGAELPLVRNPPPRSLTSRGPRGEAARPRGGATIRASFGKVLACGLALGAVGCTSINSVQRAQTLGSGKYEVSLEPSLSSGLNAATGLAVVYPGGDLSARFGASDRTDVGFRAGASGLELQTKFLLTSPDSPRVHVSLAPMLRGAVWLGVGNGMIGYGFRGAEGLGGLIQVQLPVLIGFSTGGGSELVLGPRVLNTTYFSGMDVVNAVMVGGTVGWSVRVTPRFRIHPELGAVAPIALAGATRPTQGGALVERPLTTGGVGLQLSVGFVLTN